jgi:hypothetical protein
MVPVFSLKDKPLEIAGEIKVNAGVSFGFFWRGV